MEAGAGRSNDRRRTIPPPKKQQTPPTKAERACLNFRPDTPSHSLNRGSKQAVPFASTRQPGQRPGPGPASEQRPEPERRPEPSPSRRPKHTERRTKEQRRTRPEQRTSEHTSNTEPRTTERPGHTSSTERRTSERRRSTWSSEPCSTSSGPACSTSPLPPYRRTRTPQPTQPFPKPCSCFSPEFSKPDRGRIHSRDPENLRSAVPRPDRPHFVIRTVLIDVADCAVRAVCSVNANKLAGHSHLSNRTSLES
jgi:hypothetical protein